MLAALTHRGPDDEGLLVTQRATVGMRRLSIIDLPGGGQPVWNETGTIAVLYNGEIYNFRQLRTELESLGHTFRTKSDTEVIVHAYEAWGEDCPKRFHGMFAFAIVEMPQGAAGPATKIFLARDAMGIKPALLRGCRRRICVRIGSARSACKRLRRAANFRRSIAVVSVVRLGERTCIPDRWRAIAAAGAFSYFVRG